MNQSLELILEVGIEKVGPITLYDIMDRVLDLFYSRELRGEYPKKIEVKEKEGQIYYTVYWNKNPKPDVFKHEEI
jgi:hypothetical protein